VRKREGEKVRGERPAYFLTLSLSHLLTKQTAAGSGDFQVGPFISLYLKRFSHTLFLPGWLLLGGRFLGL
jgi:hypothetical protein